MTCSVCGAALDPLLLMGHCPIEATCLTHCSDFVGHCSPVPEQEREQAAMALDLERAEVEHAQTNADEYRRQWLGTWAFDEGDGDGG